MTIHLRKGDGKAECGARRGKNVDLTYFKSEVTCPRCKNSMGAK